MLGQEAFEELGEVGVEQAAGREVDGDRDMVAGVQPAARLVERVASTRSVSLRMIPVPSAIPMNSAGGMLPCSGWLQRSNASTPTSRSSSSAYFGWKCRDS